MGTLCLLIISVIRSLIILCRSWVSGLSLPTSDLGSWRYVGISLLWQMLPVGFSFAILGAQFMRGGLLGGFTTYAVVIIAVFSESSKYILKILGIFVCIFVCLFWFWSLVVSTYRVLGSSLFPNLSPIAADLLMVLFTHVPYS